MERIKAMFLKTVCATLLLMLCLATGCDSNTNGNETSDTNTGEQTNADAVMPVPMQTIAERAAKAAEDFAGRLDGQLGDKHKELIDSGEGEDFEGYGELYNILNGFVHETAGAFVYTMAPTGDPVSSVNGFFILVDGSEPNDPYGLEYPWSAEFLQAWEGTVTADQYAWRDDVGGLRMSAYAPVHDSEGNVVAILGVDMPAPEAENYPEWIVE